MGKRWAAISRFGGVGDNLIAASPLKALKRMGYMCEVISGEPNHVVYINNPYIDKLTVKKTDTELPKNDLEGWQKWFVGRANEYDVFIQASHSCEGRHAIFKTMTSFYWSPEYRRKICAGSYLETVHDIGNVPYDFGPLFFPTDEERHNAQITKSKTGPFILWVLSGTRIDKVYPYAPMAIARILKEVDAPVLIMGGPTDIERSMAESIRDHIKLTNSGREKLHLCFPDVRDASKCWPLRTSLSLALAADLVVTPDTGTAWAVAMEPMPKIVMVSHASAENITKHWVNTTTLHADVNRVPCWPCHRLHDDPSTCVQNMEGNGAACISDISVETMVRTVYQKWDESQRKVIPFSKMVHSEGQQRKVASG